MPGCSLFLNMCSLRWPKVLFHSHICSMYGLLIHSFEQYHIQTTFETICFVNFCSPCLLINFMKVVCRNESKAFEERGKTYKGTLGCMYHISGPHWDMFITYMFIYVPFSFSKILKADSVSHILQVGMLRLKKAIGHGVQFPQLVVCICRYSGFRHLTLLSFSKRRLKKKRKEKRAICSASWLHFHS